jgi:NADH dehydrogenase FAD-containing subunit
MNANTGNGNTAGRTDTQVVVIGGGYAGVMAANRLTQRPDVTVTLVNPRPTFIHRIRLHQQVGNTGNAVVAFADVLSERVRLLVGSVDRIDADGRSLALESGETVRYDYLVYAVGSGSADPSVPGAAAFAYPIATFEEAERLAPALAAAGPQAPVTVVGSGPTGIETAAELAEAGHRVTLVCGGELNPYLHTRGRRSVAKRLARLGVKVIDGAGSRATAVTRDAVHLADGRELPSAVTIWTVGFGVPDLAVRSGLSTDALGRLLTDETLTSVDDDRILAAGDSAAPSNLPMRMSCQAAMPLGARAADTILSRIAGEQPGNVGQPFGAQCISIGRRDGIFQFANKADVAIWFNVEGAPGAKLKELVCTFVVKHLASEATKPGAYALHRAKGGAAQRLLRLRSNEAATETAPTLDRVA